MDVDATEVPGVDGVVAVSRVSKNVADALGVSGAGAPSSGGEDRGGSDGPDRATPSAAGADDEGEVHDWAAETPVGEAEECESNVAEVVEAVGADVSASGCEDSARSSVTDWDR